MIRGLYAALASSIRLAAAGGNDAWVPTQRALAALRWPRQRVRWTRGPVPTRTQRLLLTISGVTWSEAEYAPLND